MTEDAKKTHGVKRFRDSDSDCADARIVYSAEDVYSADGGSAENVEPSSGAKLSVNACRSDNIDLAAQTNLPDIEDRATARDKSLACEAPQSNAYADQDVIDRDRAATPLRSFRRRFDRKRSGQQTNAQSGKRQSARERHADKKPALQKTVSRRGLGALGAAGLASAMAGTGARAADVADPRTALIAPSLDALRELSPKRAIAIVRGARETQYRDAGVFQWVKNSRKDDGAIWLHGQGGSWRRVYDGPVNAAWFGFSPDERAKNNSLYLQRAIDYAQSTYETLALPPGMYMIDRTIRIDAARARIVGAHTILNFQHLTDDVAIDVTGSRPVNHGNPDRYIEGVLFFGPGRHREGKVGVFLHEGVNGGEAGAAHFDLRDCHVRRFDVGVRFGSQAFLNQLRDTNIQRCNWGVDFLPDSVNSFEKMSFQGCVFAVNNVAINARAKYNELIFRDCSFDFNLRAATIQSGHLQLFGCHIEFNCSQTDYAVDLAENGNGNASFFMQAGKIQVNTRRANKLRAVIRNNAAPAYTHAHFDNVVFYGLKTLSGYFAEGKGRTSIKRAVRFPNPHSTGDLLIPSANLVRNPSGAPDASASLQLISSRGEHELRSRQGDDGEWYYDLALGQGAATTLRLAAPFNGGAFCLAEAKMRVDSARTPIIGAKFGFAPPSELERGPTDFVARVPLDRILRMEGSAREWRKVTWTPDGFNFSAPSWAAFLFIDLAFQNRGPQTRIGLRDIMVNEI